MLRALDVSFTYGRPGRAKPYVLKNVSLTADRGDLIGVLGPNGSGKTTLLKILAGALLPQSGGVTLEGRSMSEWSQREIARRVALVPQETYAPFDFSVLEIVLMGRFPHLGAFALEGPEDLAIAHRALAETGTADFSERLFNTLSGGEKQRVVIASALAQSPQLLLLDEPTASLDVGHQIEVQTLPRRLNADSGVTMVLSTHDLNLAAALCRRLILIRNGQVIASGSTDNVLTKATVRRTRSSGYEGADDSHANRGHTRGFRRGTRHRVDHRAGFRIDTNFAWSRVRPDHSIRRQPGCAGLLHRASATRGCGSPGRRIPGGCGSGISGPAAQSAGDPGHAGCVERCCVGGNAGHHLSSRLRGRRPARDLPVELRRRSQRPRSRLRAGDCPPARYVHHGAPAGGRHHDGLLLGADSVRTVSGGLHRRLPHRSLVDGHAGRRWICSAADGAADDSRRIRHDGDTSTAARSPQSGHGRGDGSGCECRAG